MLYLRFSTLVGSLAWVPTRSPCTLALLHVCCPHFHLNRMRGCCCCHNHHGLGALLIGFDVHFQTLVCSFLSCFNPTRLPGASVLFRLLKAPKENGVVLVRDELDPDLWEEKGEVLFLVMVVDCGPRMRSTVIHTTLRLQLC